MRHPDNQTGEAWRDEWLQKSDRAEEQHLGYTVTKFLEVQRNALDRVGKQLEFLGKANEAIDKAKAADKILNKSADLGMDDGMLYKSIGVNSAELRKARDAWEGIATRYLELSRELDEN